MRRVLLFSGKNKEMKSILDFMEDWISGDKKLSQISEEDIAFICDVFYITKGDCIK